MLKVLGTPTLLREEVEITGLSSRRAYLLLASLALDPKTSNTEKLAVRLWPDAVNATGNLRSLLTSLKKKVGPDFFVQTRGTLRLAPGVLVTDWQLSDVAWNRALTTKDLSEKAGHLREAARHLDGIFLETLDTPPDGDGWLAGMRAEAEARKAEIGEQFAHVLEETGDFRGAYEAASQILALDPERTDLQRMVLRLSSGVKPRGRIRLLAKNLGLDELLPQLEQARSPDTRLTLREEQTLAVALDAALSRLPRKQCLAAHQLSVFPQPFTPEQAAAITGMDGMDASTLEALLAPCVLRRTGGRYIVPPDLRPLLARKLTPVQKERVHTRHRDYFLEYCAAISLLQHEALYTGFTAEKANLLQAVEQTLASPLTPQRLLFVYNVIFYLRTQDAPLCRYVCKQALPVLESALTSPESEIARAASHLIARILIHFEADFTRGAQYLARSAPYWTKDSVPFLMDWLLATHYMPNDTAFSMIYTVAEELLDTLDPPDRANLHCNMLTCLADRQTARGNYTGALDANVQALELIEAWDHLRDDGRRAACLEQRGGILHALGKREEALSALDRALPIFKARGATHRVADCYQQIGAILGEMGLNGIARERIEEAISLYESIHSPHSRAGALRTLGNVYKRMGDRDTARALYEESLAVWKSVPHPEWIARLEKCLTELGA